MLYLDPYQEEVDLADNDVFEVVPDKENLSFQGVCVELTNEHTLTCCIQIRYADNPQSPLPS